MLAGLPYVVWPIGSLFILVSRKKDDPFLHYHAVQALLAGGLMGVGTLLLILALVISFRVMPGSSTYFPAFLGMGTVLVGSALALTIVLAAIFLGWRATEGEMLRIPYLGDFAEEKMLDHTGMTRRQFEAMLLASMEPEREADIPFPELKAEEPPRTTNRLEATRQARAKQEAPAPSRPPLNPQNPLHSPSSTLPRSRSPQLPPSPQPRPVSWDSVGQSQSQSQAPPSVAPTVREVDLIGHYKDKKVETGPKGGQNNDVLRQWLSSVDNE